MTYKKKVQPGIENINHWGRKWKMERV